MPPNTLSINNDSTTSQSMGTTTNSSAANLSITTTTTANCGTAAHTAKQQLQQCSPCSSQPASGHRVSFKRRASRMRINRETDIMLIVLSFSILLSQLPFAVTWYLIYYQSILKRDQADELFASATIPIYLYAMRLVEMVYYSLNFLFYITLSPSLRREIKSYQSGRVLLEVLCFRKKKQATQATNGGGRVAAAKSGGPSPTPNLPSPVEPTPVKRLCSNSSCEYVDYIVRSVSPLKRPSFLLPSSPMSVAKFDDDDVPPSTPANGRTSAVAWPGPGGGVKTAETSTTLVNKEHKSRLIKSFFLKTKPKKKSPKSTSLTPSSQTTGSKLNDKSSKIKIVIDNLYDEEEELKIDDDIIIDNFSSAAVVGVATAVESTAPDAPTQPSSSTSSETTTTTSGSEGKPIEQQTESSSSSSSSSSSAGAYQLLVTTEPKNSTMTTTTTTSCKPNWFLSSSLDRKAASNNTKCSVKRAVGDPPRNHKQTATTIEDEDTMTKKKNQIAYL
jgi:hypothetical protein